MKSLRNSPDFQEAALLDAAQDTIAGGVVSLNRKVDPLRIFCRALGSRLWDIQGREYIDYHAAFAPHLLGHNCTAVNEAVHQAMQAHWSLMGSGPTPWEIELAGLLVEAVPSVDLVQLTNTGSEAVSLAIRLCRAYTGREDIVLTLGGYNGWQDDVARVVMPTADQAGPRVSAGEYSFLPASAGIPEATRKRVHVINYNDLESLEHVLEKYPVACVLTEPVLQNIGVVRPKEGYLQGLIDLCEKHGSLCVFDEVKTGFRTSLAGYQGAHNLTPHLSVFGKAVANGYPMGVIGGRADIMNLFNDPDPQRRVLVAGTYNAHPFNCAAAIATLRQLQDPDLYKELRQRSRSLYTGLRELLSEKGMAHVLVENESAFCVYFMEEEPHDCHAVLAGHDFELDRRYRTALIGKGIYHIPVACKQGSVSTAHSQEDIDHTLDVTRDVLNAL